MRVSGLALLSCLWMEADTLEFDFSPQALAGPDRQYEAYGSTDGFWQILPGGEGIGSAPSADPPEGGERASLLVHRREDLSDYRLTARIRLEEGQEGGGAGLVFRWQDPGNYYSARLDAKEGWFVFRKVVNGAEEDPIGNRVPIRQGRWHELEVVCRGTHIELELDGQALPVLIDSQFASGRAGLWALSGTAASFSRARLVSGERSGGLDALVREALEKHRSFLSFSLYAARKEGGAPEVVATSGEEALGTLGDETVIDSLRRRNSYTARQGDDFIVTLPVRDRNGEGMAVCRIRVRASFGLSRQRALARCLPVARSLEGRFPSREDLLLR